MKKISFSLKRNLVQFVESLSKAVSHVKSGDVILLGGFGICGIAEALFEGLNERVGEINNLTFVGITPGLSDVGPGLLTESGMYIGECDNVIEKYWNGDIEIEFIPQGTLAEKLRAAGHGIPAFYTPTGTPIQYGEIVQKYNEDGTPEIMSESREGRVFDVDGREYIMENSIYGDIAFVKGWKSDKLGNIVCRGTALNLNPECAQAAKFTIVEVEEIVETGELSPNEIDIQNIHVDVVYQTKYEKTIERRTFLDEESEDDSAIDLTKEMIVDVDNREKIARRVALEFSDGDFCNVGIGIPTLASNYLPEGVSITLHSENGVLGLGPFPKEDEIDADYTNASKQTVTVLPGSSIFSSSKSFGIIRGKHLEMTILGGLQVSENGDLANWVIPGKLLKGMGGAMDLVGCGSPVIVSMEHVTPKNEPKILKECAGIVSKIITDIAVFEIIDKQLILKEKAFWVTVEDIKSCTEAEFLISDDIKDIEYSLV